MKTLVLDLDGTLVHAIDNKNDTQGHVTLKMKDDDGALKTVNFIFWLNEIKIFSLVWSSF